MKKQILILIAVLIMLPTIITKAQTDSDHLEDEKAIRQVVQNIEDAWAAGDGKKFADNFTDDVDFMVWNGLEIHGREENIKGHQEIFDTFYKGTKIRSEIRKIRFLSDDIAVVHAQSEMFRDGRKVKDVPKVVPLMILQKQEGKWKVVVFQNTPIINRGELVVGRKPEKETK